MGDYTSVLWENERIFIHAHNLRRCSHQRSSKPKPWGSFTSFPGRTTTSDPGGPWESERVA